MPAILDRIRSAWRLAAEVRAYFLVSCCGLATDAGVLLFLNRVCGLPYLLAASVSFTVGGIVGYQLCIRFVWPACLADARPYRLLSFLLLGTVGLLINEIIMAIAVDLIHAPLLAAKAMAAGCTFLSNYLLRRRWAIQAVRQQVVNE